MNYYHNQIRIALTNQQIFIQKIENVANKQNLFFNVSALVSEPPAVMETSWFLPTAMAASVQSSGRGKGRPRSLQVRLKGCFDLLLRVLMK
jgi:hypothetical protein